VIGPLLETWIDGRPGSMVSCTDRGLQYGDGLFETISCRRGARWLPWHLERLRAGVARLRLPFDDFDALRAEIETLAADQERCLIKAIVTRGAATRRGYAPDGRERATRVVSRYQWPAMLATTDPYRVGLSDVRLGNNALLAGLKHLNRLEQVLAQLACAGSGFDEVLMMSATGQLISGSMSNVFLANATGLFTPAITECGVEGVMRRVVLQSALSAGMTVSVRPVSISELSGVQELFLTNVRLGVQSVDWLNGRTLQSRQYAQQLRRLIDETYA
jgi:4-amino-4-deoxychorismate lyase